QACPPSAGYQLRKFARRHKARLMTVALPALVLLLGSIGLIWWRAAEANSTAQAVAQGLEEGEIWGNPNQWGQADQALERAKVRLEGSGLKALQARVEERRRQASFVDQSEKARFQLISSSWREYRDYLGADRVYPAAFVENGLDLAALDKMAATRL